MTLKLFLLSFTILICILFPQVSSKVFMDIIGLREAPAADNTVSPVHLPNAYKNLKINDICIWDDYLYIYADKTIYVSSYNQSDALNTITFVNPMFGLKSSWTDVKNFWCRQDTKENRMFIFRNTIGTFAQVHSPYEQFVAVENGALDIAIGTNHIYYLLFDNLIRTCSIESCDNEHDYPLDSDIVSFLFPNGFVAKDNMITLIGPDVSSDYFSGKCEISQVKAYGDSLIILCDGQLYGFIDEADRLLFEDYFGAGSCTFGNTPCSYDLNQSIDSIEVTSDGKLYLLSKTSSLVFTPDGSISYFDAVMRKMIKPSGKSPIFFINDEDQLYHRGIYEKDNLVLYFNHVIYEMRELYVQVDVNTRLLKTRANEFILVSSRNEVFFGDERGFRESFGFAQERVVDIDFFTDTGNHRYIWISRHSLYYGNTLIGKHNLVLEKLAIYTHAGNVYIFVKTTDNKLLYAKIGLTNGEVKISPTIYSSIHIVDVSQDMIITKNENNVLEYYGIGGNRGSRFGQYTSNEYIYRLEIVIEGLEDSYNSFMRLQTDVPEPVVKVFLGNQNNVVITDHKRTYGRGDNSMRSLKDDTDTFSPYFAKLNGDFDNDDACHCYVTHNSLLFIQLCDGRIYKKGLYEIEVAGYKDWVMQLPVENSYELQLRHPITNLRGILSLQWGTILIYNDDSDSMDCINGSCTIDKDIDLDGEEIILDNSVTIITSNVTIVDGNVIVNVPPGGVPIIVDGGQLTLDSTTLTYQIDSKEVFDNIKDGDSIVIIETKNNGTIEGEFSEVIVEYAQSDGECKIVTAKAA